MTNGEEIRQISYEEIAKKYYCNFTCVRCPASNFCGLIIGNAKSCEKVILNWLAQEAKDE